MRKRIVRVSPFRAGKVMTLWYGLMCIPVGLITVLRSWAEEPSLAKRSLPSSFFIGEAVLVIIFMVIFIFIFSVFAAWLYNVVAKWTGGIEYESQEQADS